MNSNDLNRGGTQRRSKHPQKGLQQFQLFLFSHLTSQTKGQHISHYCFYLKLKCLMQNRQILSCQPVLSLQGTLLLKYLSVLEQKHRPTLPKLMWLLGTTYTTFETFFLNKNWRQKKPNHKAWYFSRMNKPTHLHLKAACVETPHMNVTQSLTSHNILHGLEEGIYPEDPAAGAQSRSRESRLSPSRHRSSVPWHLPQKRAGAFHTQVVWFFPWAKLLIKVSFTMDRTAWMVANTEGRIMSAYIFVEKYIQIQVATKIERKKTRVGIIKKKILISKL